MTKTTTKELYGRYAAGERDFSGVDMSDCVIRTDYVEDYDPNTNVLKEINLSGANLSRASLDFVNLIRANLSGADLSYAQLGFSDLTDANLQGANLTLTEFYGTNLTDADLRHTININIARFNEANLSGADLRQYYDVTISGRGILLHNTIMPNGRIMTGDAWVDS
jgi:uncharacterized protein YjbI with pentapeptide repeats